MTIQVPIAKVALGEEEIQAALEVLKSGALIQGPKVKAFEEAFAEKVGAKHAVAVSSGTSALHVAYLALLKEGDEVLVPSFSHISTASMVCYAGGHPVFCDVDRHRYTISLDEIKSKITPKTSAITPVHLFGNACEIDEIQTIAREHNLKIIWDAAQAHSTEYKGKDIGGFDDAVCYSFYPTKNMITGEGGIVTTNDESLAEKMRLLRAHGQSKKYFHTSLGLNYRMTDLEAVIGLEQLKKLDTMIARRRDNAAFLMEQLADVSQLTLPQIPDHVKSSFHQYSVVLEDSVNRDQFMEHLQGKGIGCAVHYPRGIHQQPVFEDRYGKCSLPNIEYLSEHIVSLPVHQGIGISDLTLVVNAVKSFFK